MATNQVERFTSLFSGALTEGTRQELIGLLDRIFHPASAFSGSLERVDLSIDSTATTPLSELLNEIGTSVVANSIQYRHKWAMAHMVPPTATVGIIGDLLIGALNQCAFIWEEAPVAAALEEAVLRWMAAKLRLASESKGLLTSGGTMSNYLAATFAKARIEKMRTFTDNNLYAVATDQAHFSIRKTLRLLGLPDNRLICAKAGPDGRTPNGCILEAADAIAREGGIPFLFVCTAGTTSAGIIEPANEFLHAAEKYGAWCHIDAAHGGSVCLTHRYDNIVDTWSAADSISWDPHKSMFVPYSIGALFVQSAKHLDILRVTSEYALKPEVTDSGDDVGATHFYTSRRLDALKLWMTIRHFGDEGFEAATCHCVDLASAFAKIIATTPSFELYAYPETNIVCFRVVVKGLTSNELNQLNAATQSRLFATGGPLLSSTTLNGRTYLRAVLMNPLLQAHDLDCVLHEILLVVSSTAKNLFGRSLHEDTSSYQPTS